jgi:hypothetical protein
MGHAPDPRTRALCLTVVPVPYASDFNRISISVRFNSIAISPLVNDGP